MNVNVIVFNVIQDSRSISRRRDREDRSSGNFSKYDSTGREQVIELVPEDGAWTEKHDTTAVRSAILRSAYDQKALRASSAGMNSGTTYDHEGRVRRSAEQKGLRINITA